MDSYSRESRAIRTDAFVCSSCHGFFFTVNTWGIERNDRCYCSYCIENPPQCCPVMKTGSKQNRKAKVRAKKRKELGYTPNV